MVDAQARARSDGGASVAITGGGRALTVKLPAAPAVRGDRLALQLLLDNLLDNAIKYSSATRSIAVTARYEAPMVVVAVRDKGAGILAREIDQVTRRFFRGSGAPPGGNGLGLAIVKKIVDEHHGRILVENVKPHGANVSIVLPPKAA
jgi:signal transduction histidine kinase